MHVFVLNHVEVLKPSSGPDIGIIFIIEAQVTCDVCLHINKYIILAWFFHLGVHISFHLNLH